MPAQSIHTSDPETIGRVAALWAENRLVCGWFTRADFVPRTADEARRCLAWIKQHGDRELYIAARRLERCL